MTYASIPIIGVYFPVTGSWFCGNRSASDSSRELRAAYGAGDNLKVSSLLVFHEPSPATTLNASKVCVELLLKSIKASPGAVDRGRKLTGRKLAAAVLLRGQVLPEERMVHMPTGNCQSNESATRLLVFTPRGTSIAAAKQSALLRPSTEELVRASPRHRSNR